MLSLLSEGVSSYALITVLLIDPYIIRGLHFMSKQRRTSITRTAAAGMECHASRQARGMSIASAVRRLASQDDGDEHSAAEESYQRLFWGHLDAHAPTVD